MKNKKIAKCSPHNFIIIGKLKIMFKRCFKRLVPLQFYREKQTVENKLLIYGGDRCRV